MGFAGLKSDAEIEAVIAYLKSFPAPLILRRLAARPFGTH